MTSLMELNPWKFQRLCLLKLALFYIICFGISSDFTPVNGFNLLQSVHDMAKENFNTTIEIAVVVPEYELQRNTCCPINESVCGRPGTQCQCHQEDDDCLCLCPTEQFPIGFNFNINDCCSVNNTYCRHFGDNCACEQDDSGCRCVCPSELGYSVKLAAGIAIVLLIAVTVMLAISLYRRAAQARRRRRSSSRGDSISSELSSSSSPEPPPRYADVYLISSPKTEADSTDFEKLPSYEEALTMQARADPQAQTSLNIKIIGAVNSAVIRLDEENPVGKSFNNETSTEEWTTSL